MSETSHYLNTGHSFIYVLSVRDIALSSTGHSFIYVTGHSFISVLSVRDVALSKHRSLIYIRPKCQRRHII